MFNKHSNITGVFGEIDGISGKFFLFPSKLREIKVLNIEYSSNQLPSVFTISEVKQIVSADPGNIIIIHKKDGADSTTSLKLILDKKSQDKISNFSETGKNKFMKGYTNARVSFLADESGVSAIKLT